MKCLILLFLIIGSAHAAVGDKFKREVKALDKQADQSVTLCDGLKEERKLACVASVEKAFGDEIASRAQGLVNEVLQKEHSDLEAEAKEAACVKDRMLAIDEINIAKPGTVVVSGGETCKELEALLQAHAKANPAPVAARLP